MQRKRQWWQCVAVFAVAALLLPASGCSTEAQALAYKFGTGVLDTLLTALQSALTAGLTPTT
jgi:hypothetical protein